MSEFDSDEYRARRFFEIGAAWPDQLTDQELQELSRHELACEGFVFGFMAWSLRDSYDVRSLAERA